MNGLVGRRLGRYEIVSFLGAGGMGEVYRARDTQLGRPVAVKVISAEASHDPTRLDRFEKEARAVALLSHPNILDIHDFGVDDGIAYAVTELLEGQSLRERIGGSPLPIAKALEIGRAVAEGLAAGHSKGIVHRDIKPENIFITSTGQVKILDFGIASLKGEAVADTADGGTPTVTATAPGQVMGTVGYMSPEQVRGRPADARSDIFSLGCVLFEMLTGHRAFSAETAADTMLAILLRDPPPLATARPDVPPALSLVVARCLEKQPEERFESARDVAFDLKAVSLTRETVVAGARTRQRRRPWAARAGMIALVGLAVGAVALLVVRPAVFAPMALPTERRLAVTQITDAADDRGLQVSGAGLTRILADNLVLIEEQTRGTLWVLPGITSGFRDATRLRTLGRHWGVTLILATRVEKATSQLRFTLTLVEPAGGQALRSAAVRDQPGNISALQVEPVLEVAKMLGVTVSPETRSRLVARTTNVTAAFEAYVIGVGLLQGELKNPDLDRAVEKLRSVVSADPAFAPARVALARAYLRKYERTRDAQWLDTGVGEAEQAARVGLRACEAYAVIADLYRAAGRKPEVVSSLKRAVELCPENAESHMALGRAYQAAGKTNEAEAELQRAIYLRPGYWPGYHWLARLFLSQGTYESAATEFRHVIESAPGDIGGYNNLGYTYAQLDRRQEAQEMFERSLAIEPNENPFAFLNLGTLYFEDARFGDAAALFEKALRLRSDNYAAWGNLAYAHKYGLAPEKATECFRRAIDLAEEQRQKEPGDPQLLGRLASYYATVGERTKGMEALTAAIACKPAEPQLVALIAMACEDLGERERALEWVGRAFEKGIPPTSFESQPSLRALIADERYRKLADAREKVQ